MKSLVVVTILLFGLVDLQGQQRTFTALPKNVRLDRNKPGVYITVERIGELKSPDAGDEKRRVWLRLHNNTRWPIVLEMSSPPSAEYGDAGLFYDTLSGDEVILRIQCHVCTLNNLGAGKSLLFSIPQGFASKIRIPPTAVGG